MNLWPQQTICSCQEIRKVAVCMGNTKVTNSKQTITPRYIFFSNSR